MGKPTTTTTTASSTTSSTTSSELSPSTTSSALLPAPSLGLAALVSDLHALTSAEGLDAAALPEQVLPSLALPTVQIDRPAAAPARWWSKRVEELRGYPAAAPASRKDTRAGEEGVSLGAALRCALVSYRERWEERDEASGALLATPGYRPGAKRRAQVLAALPLHDEVSGARWELVTLTAGGLAASTLRAAYTSAVKARRAVLNARKAPLSLSPLLPAELVLSTSEPRPVPGATDGSTFVHAVVTCSPVIFEPAAGLGELLVSERATVEEWAAGVGWVDVMTPGTVDDDGDDAIPFGRADAS